MTVAELIEELKLYNPNQEVFGVVEDESGVEEYPLIVPEGTYVNKVDGVFRICFHCYYA